ncbi:hypothetical protein [Kitasatospora sp. NPDC094015]|uniref:hypothetical protein n=1 Tax=Kitasatospora sp. NPDC094015 TaxID=3155205 RepID=UPI00332208DD
MAAVFVLVLLVAGVGLIVSGMDKLQTRVPTCFGRPMEPGDICRARPTGTLTDGMPEPHDSTYQEQLSGLTSGGWTSIVLGAVLLLLGMVIAAAWMAGSGQDERR